jgi:cytochrome c oxidase subunit I+III
MVVLLLVAGSLYLAFVFSYLYLWTVSPQLWSKPLAAPLFPALSALLLAASSGLIALAGHLLPAGSRRGASTVLLVAAAVVLLAGATGIEIFAHWRAGLRPDADAHAALTFMASLLQLQLVLALVVMAGFAIARRLAGLLNRRRRVVFDNLSLLWHYTVAQGLLGLLLVHGFPRIV